MPSFRGIEVSILTKSEIGKLPEYPRPDESCLQPFKVHETPRSDQVPLPVPDEQDSVENVTAHVAKANQKISVYVQSLPGSQFCINYVVERVPSTASHLFFKLYINGRHMTSWGIDPKIRSMGCVEKALYEPCHRWNQQENGVVFKQEGIEARYFYFVSDQQQLSVADDGGLIEVHVFRAKGRKRRAAKLDQYRQLDKYGIAAPSGGLVDNPQDVTFFDFHLIDPKDTPFATFQFHYRSLANLHQLNLIPAEEPSILSSPPTSAAGRVVESISKSSFTILEDDSCVEEQLHSVRGDTDESVFEDSTMSGALTIPASCEAKSRRNSSYTLRTPPLLRPRPATSQHLPQPSKGLRDAVPPGFPESYMSRPLPDLPVDGPNDAYVPRPRKSSTASATPSIAPSLLSYVQNESYSEETVEYGQGLAIPIAKDHPGVPLNEEQVLSGSVYTSAHAHPSILMEKLSVADSSMSDCEGSPLTTDDSKEYDPTLLSPHNYIATADIALEEHQGHLVNKQATQGRGSGSPVGTKSPRKKRGDTVDLANDFARFPHLQLSESEWIRRSPSPQQVPRRILSPRLGRLWTTLRRSKSRSPLRNMRSEAASRNHSTPQLPGCEAKERSGNWI